jgi:hypothetical protein
MGYKKIMISAYNQGMRKSNMNSDLNKNSMREKSSIIHCRIVPWDARKCEEALIAHRLDPLYTLCKFLGMIIEYTCIPIGDTPKVTQAI